MNIIEPMDTLGLKSLVFSKGTLIKTLLINNKKFIQVISIEKI